ncbi:DMT family transporter [Leucobacter denitrificans]|uniref:DMT family transporter n=1 Tax=Leucobacter denitrificans TaxID=683042 RepID=UPI001FE41707|nr:DMT family transporter [Leucobacter denitrificans]
MSVYTEFASAWGPVDHAAAAVASLDPRQFWGIPLALVGAALLAFGAQYQSRGLNKVERLTGESAHAGLSIRHMLSLFRRPSWIVGTLLLGLAVVFQLGSLSLSPITLVQPIGVVGLVITSVLNSRISGVRLGKRVTGAIALAVVSIAIFVFVAATNVTDQRITDEKLVTVLIAFGAVFLVALTLFALFRKRGVALIYIVGAGVLYGFVATLAKVLISRFQQGDFEWHTWACAVALIAGALLGMLFVQNAYSSGPPDLVVAGLTVIDPMVAVLIGILILGEASNAPAWVAVTFVITGVTAVIGVMGISKFHPQTGKSVLDHTGSLPVVTPLQPDD